MGKLAYGLRDVKLRPIADDGTVGVGVDLPVARTFTFSETEAFEELRGDDKVQASHGSGPTVEWSLESGGLDLEAYAVMAGGTVTLSGTGSTAKKTYNKKVTDARPYFQVEGQAIADDGGDMHGLVYRAKADGSLEGEFGDGTFWLTKAAGKGYANDDDDVYDFVQNVTATPITD